MARLCLAWELGRAALVLAVLLPLSVAACGGPAVPEPPSSLRYGYVGSVVVLVWDASARADSYSIYSGELGCGVGSGHPVICRELASGVWDTLYVHDSPGAEPSGYWVVACNGSGCSEIDAASPARLMPRSPGSVRVSREGSSLEVTWDPVPGATRYSVYHNPGSPRCYTSDPYPQCDELDGNVTGTTYTHTIPVPDPPFSVTVVDRSADALTLGWRVGGYDQHYWVAACSDAGCSIIASNVHDFLPASYDVPPGYYRVSRATEDGATQEMRYTPLGSSLDRFQYVDKGLQPNTVYYYGVKACNDSGCSGGSSRRAAGLTESDGSVDAPSTPTGLQGEKIVRDGVPDDVRVTWDPVEGATYYELWIGGVPSSSFELGEEISAPLHDQSFGTSANRGFFGEYETTSYKVRACNEVDCSPFSEIITVQ